MSSSIHKAALPSDTDGCQDVVTSNHHSSDVGSQKLLQNSRRGRLELILKDDESYKVEVTFDISSSHLLSLDPAELLEVTAGNTDDTVTLVRVE